MGRFFLLFDFIARRERNARREIMRNFRVFSVDTRLEQEQQQRNEEKKREVKHETMRKEFKSTFPLFFMISELLVAAAVFARRGSGNFEFSPLDSLLLHFKRSTLHHLECLCADCSRTTMSFWLSMCRMSSHTTRFLLESGRES